ncbi:2Fe-2S iron-sulfur cluster binding domain-containing protein [Rhodococcus zopfii]|uniref:2Fe-2S iron-sulfur cluster binding domain-containing protein n=2 Tax=Rhodococcus zopfii TaxID=43772 RepID=A0ABU3WU79_9NOCA|nr:2Fe-2S iron-sulfur cluster binding domain-containing protein [Rhodococcus zopfii]
MSSSLAPLSDPAVVGHYRVTVEPSGDSFVVRPGENILAAGRRAGVWLPFECGWGSCGTCKATLVSGEVELLFPEAPAIDPRDERRRRKLTCQTTATTDVTLKVTRLGPFEERPTTDRVAQLVDKRELGPGICSFTFALDAPADFRPGQYAILELGPDLRRCYSMAGGPGDEITFVAKHYEGRPGSTALHALEVGASVPIAVPFGDMWLRDDDSPRDPDRGRYRRGSGAVTGPAHGRAAPYASGHGSVRRQHARGTGLPGRARSRGRATARRGARAGGRAGRWHLGGSSRLRDHPVG